MQKSTPLEPMMQLNNTHKTLQAIAIYEAIKGLLALLLIMGLVSLLHQDIRHVVLNIIGHFGLNAQAHYPSLVLHWADVLNDSNQQSLFLLGTAYVVLRLIEAYGLWFGHVWSEWLAALSGSIYLTFEARHMWHVPSWSSLLIFFFNALMVIYLAYRLWSRQHRPTKSTNY